MLSTKLKDVRLADLSGLTDSQRDPWLKYSTIGDFLNGSIFLPTPSDPCLGSESKGFRMRSARTRASERLLHVCMVTAHVSHHEE